MRREPSYPRPEDRVVKVTALAAPAVGARETCLRLGLEPFVPEGNRRCDRSLIQVGISMRLIFITLLFSLVAGAQNARQMDSVQPRTQFQAPKQLPDAPSAAKPRPKPSAWRYQWRPWDDQLEERTFGETLRSPWFILPFATLLAINAGQ